MIVLACICGGVGEVALFTALAGSSVVAGCVACIKRHINKKKECECECHDGIETDPS